MSDNLEPNSNEFEEINPLPWWQRLLYVFTRPEKVFSNLAHYPKFLAPLLVIILGIPALNLIRMNLYKAYMKEQYIQQYIAQDMDIPANIEMMVNSALIGLAFAGVVAIVILIIKSFFLNGVASVMNGDGSFKDGLSVVLHAYLPVVAGQVVIAIISLIIGKYNVPMNFSILLPESSAGTYVYNLLAQLDIFTIWYQVLAVIGVAKVYNMPTKKAIIPVLAPWAAYLLVVVGFTSIITSSMVGM